MAAPAAPPPGWVDRFLQATQRNELDQVQALLAQPGADVNARSPEGMTALMVAAQAGDRGDEAAVIGALLAAGADPNIQRPPRNVTALLLAAELDFADAVRRLMDHPATNPNLQTNLGDTALHIAAAGPGLEEVFEVLLDPRPEGAQPVNLNVQDNAGNTPLIVAAVRNSLAKTFELLRAGADKTVRNNAGNTARVLANIGGLANIVRLLDAPPDQLQAVYNQIRAANRGAAALGVAPAAGPPPMPQIRAGPPPAGAAAGPPPMPQIRAGPPPAGAAAGPPPMPQIRAPVGAPLGPAPRVDPTENLPDAEAFRIFDDRLSRERVDESAVPADSWNKPFEGIFEDDFVMLQGILEDPLNTTLCPLCLGVVVREAGCLYMRHDCRMTELEQRGRENIVLPSEAVYHQRLFNLYNINGSINWCGACGRICGGQGRPGPGRAEAIGHQHYHLAPYQDTTRADLHSSRGEYFDVRKGGDSLCLQTGGGGFDEKIKRVNRLLKMAAELQYNIGKMTRKEALYILIEEAWNAPLFRDPDLERVKAEKKFSVPFSDFPQRRLEEASDSKGPEGAAESKEAEDIPKPADQAANVPELVLPAEGQEFLLDADGNPRMDPLNLEDMREGIRFTHKRRDGTVYRHTDDELISREGLTQWITETAAGTAKFGRCFLDACDARLWPVDVEPYIPADVLATYKRDFNTYMRGKIGGAKKKFGITYEIENHQCTFPLKPPRKGGRSYRKKHRKTGKRKTYRRT